MLYRIIGTQGFYTVMGISHGYDHREGMGHALHFVMLIPNAKHMSELCVEPLCYGEQPNAIARQLKFMLHIYLKISSKL
jgi:hypothetical protein